MNYPMTCGTPCSSLPIVLAGIVTISVQSQKELSAIAERQTRVSLSNKHSGCVTARLWYRLNESDPRRLQQKAPSRALSPHPRRHVSPPAWPPICGLLFLPAGCPVIALCHAACLVKSFRLWAFHAPLSLTIRWFGLRLPHALYCLPVALAALTRFPLRCRSTSPFGTRATPHAFHGHRLQLYHIGLCTLPFFVLYRWRCKQCELRS